MFAWRSAKMETYTTGESRVDVVSLVESKGSG